MSHPRLRNNSRVAGFSIPTQRTLYMLAIFAVALWGGRHVSMIRVLAIALFAVVLLDPWSVNAPGFWLSFGAVTVITYALSGQIALPHWLTASIRTQWAVTIGLVPALILKMETIPSVPSCMVIVHNSD